MYAITKQQHLSIFGGKMLSTKTGRNSHLFLVNDRLIYSTISPSQSSMPPIRL